MDSGHHGEVQKGVPRRRSIGVFWEQKKGLRRKRIFEEQDNDMLSGADHEDFGELEKGEKRSQIKLRKRIECDLVEESITGNQSEVGELVFGDDYEDQKKALELAKKLSKRKQKEAVTYGPQSVTELGAPNICLGYIDAGEGDAQQNKVVITEMDFMWPLQLNEETCKPEEDVFMDGEDIFSDATLGVYTKRRKVAAVEDRPATYAEEKEVIPDEVVHETVIGKGLAGAMKFLQGQGAIMGSNIGVRIDFSKRKKNIFAVDNDMPLLSKHFSIDDDILLTSKEILIEAQTPDLIQRFQEIGILDREPLIDVSTFHSLLKKLGNIIQEIYNNDATSLRFQELCRTAYILINHGYASGVYHALKDTVGEHLRKIAKIVEAAQDGLFLEDLQRRWADYSKAAGGITHSLQLLDNPKHQTINMKPSSVLVLVLWREIIVLSPFIHWRLQDTLLDLIRRERMGEKINRGLIRNITDMLMEMGSDIYENVFERPFLEESASFYSRESQHFIECCDCDEYLSKTVRCCTEESERARQYLHSTSADKIANVLAKELLANRMQKLFDLENCLQSILMDMLVSDKREELTMMYGFLKHVPDGHLTIRTVLSSYVKETGKTLVTDPARLSRPVDFVQHLLNEKDKYDEIVSVSFRNDNAFQNVLIASFDFINLNNRSAEFISLYVDDKLRKAVKEANEEDIETVLDKVMFLFRCLQEKDAFEKYYRQHLAKRLLSGKSTFEAERSMLVKLKTECGLYFTTKLVRMFMDMKTSHDTMQSFFSSSVNIGGPALSVQILTTGSWPTKPCATCNLPSEILDASEKFRAHYIGSYSGRTLAWQTNMGTADITATFGSHTLELNVSTYQMCVLMLFNLHDGLTYKDIEQATAIPHVDLKRCLQSLACVKGKNVLRKEPMSKDISESDTFYYNDKFTSKLVRVKIGTVVAQPEMMETCHRVEEDRKPQIEAAIMKILKSRKVLSHNSIVIEVTKQLQSSFLPNPVDIKKRIESLMDRDYLERDKTDRKLYRYVA